MKRIFLLACSIMMITASCKSDNTNPNNKNTASTQDVQEVVKEQTLVSNTEYIETNNASESESADNTKTDNTKTEGVTLPKITQPKVTKATPVAPKKEATPTSKDQPMKQKNKVSNIGKEVKKPNTDKPKVKDEKTIDTKKPERKTEIVKQEKGDISSNNGKPELPINPEVPAGFPNHDVFNSFLKSYVSSNGKVNYTKMKANEGQLDKYLASLEDTNITTTWNRNEKLAFWINAYNAYTIKLILNNHPVNKITDLHGGKPWDQKWIKLNGKTLSLNNIENDIIRPDFKEPRIHFAVNCAAKSCPPLLNRAYMPSKLEAQLDSQTKKFINNEQYNTLTKNEISVSKIFDWYGVDFGDVAAYVAKYANSTVKPSAEVKYNEYDWSLNN